MSQIKGFRGSTNPSGLSKAKLYSIVIQTYFIENGIRKILSQIQNKIGYLEVMYHKVYDYCKSTIKGVTEKDILMEYPHILAKIDSICLYFWRL